MSVDSNMIQYNYMLQEGTGDRANKGADSVVSMLNHTIENNIRDGVKHLALHADNCGGRSAEAEAASFRMELCQLRMRVEEVEEERNYHAAKAQELEDLLRKQKKDYVHDELVKKSEAAVFPVFFAHS